MRTVSFTKELSDQSSLFLPAELSLKDETVRLGYSLYREMFGTKTLPAATLYQNIGKSQFKTVKSDATSRRAQVFYYIIGFF